jgi:hypothetical protein
MKRKNSKKPFLESVSSDSSSEDERLLSMITRSHTAGGINKSPKDSPFFRRVSNIFKKSESKEKNNLEASTKGKKTSPTILQPLIGVKKTSPSAKRALVLPSKENKFPQKKVFNFIPGM